MHAMKVGVKVTDNDPYMNPAGSDLNFLLGFFGDGYKCMPLEKRGCTEAEWAVANCGKNHMCMVDAKGVKDCDMCKMGFEMIDGECVGELYALKGCVQFC